MSKDRFLLQGVYQMGEDVHRGAEDSLVVVEVRTVEEVELVQVEVEVKELGQQSPR